MILEISFGSLGGSDQSELSLASSTPQCSNADTKSALAAFSFIPLSIVSHHAETA